MKLTAHQRQLFSQYLTEAIDEHDQLIQLLTDKGAKGGMQERSIRMRNALSFTRTYLASETELLSS